MFRPRLTSLSSISSVTLKVRVSPVPPAQLLSGMLAPVVFSKGLYTYQVKELVSLLPL